MRAILHHDNKQREQIKVVKIQAYLTATLMKTRKKLPSLTSFLLERRTKALTPQQAEFNRQEFRELEGELKEFLASRKDTPRGIQRSTR